jgi:3-oxoacyl-[acyl-carrier-protein] synthase III
MTVCRAFVSGLAYSVGEIKPIEALGPVEGVGEGILKTLRLNGLEHYCDESRSLSAMCLSSAAATLSRLSLDAKDISAVVLANSNSDAIVCDEDETTFFTDLHNAGFLRARVVGLALQSCSACGDALSIASGLVGGQSTDTRVLVIVFCRRKKMSRLGPQGNLVFSDGAVSCVVSAEHGDFEIRASESLTNTALGMLSRSGSMTHLQVGARELSNLSKSLSGQSGVQPSAVRAFFGINAGVSHLRVMAQAAGVPLNKVYYDDVQRYGHVHSCDSLISLSNYAEMNVLSNEDSFMLMSWSPHIVCGSILRYAGRQ